MTFHAKRGINRELISFTSSSEEETILTFFYLILDELYKLGTVAGLDIREYAASSLTSFQLER